MVLYLVNASRPLTMALVFIVGAVNGKFLRVMRVLSVCLLERMNTLSTSDHE